MPLARLARPDIQAQKPLRSDEEDVRVRLAPPAGKQPVVRTHDLALEAVEELAEVRRLELEVAALRARGERDRDAVRVQVPHELERAWEGSNRRPSFVLQDSPCIEEIVDCEERREVGEEREQVRSGFAFGCIQWKADGVSS